MDITEYHRKVIVPGKVLYPSGHWLNIAIMCGSSRHFAVRLYDWLILPQLDWTINNNLKFACVVRLKPRHYTLPSFWIEDVRRVRHSPVPLFVKDIFYIFP